MQDRIASLNGRTVQLVIRQDRPAFIRLIGISVLQSAASAVLAPSLRHVADALALTWRKRLTAAAHSRYFRGNTFYTTSQLAGGQAEPLHSLLHSLACLLMQMHECKRAWCTHSCIQVISTNVTAMVKEVAALHALAGSSRNALVAACLWKLYLS